jgi:SAM-dependent methyltransferase
MHQEQWEVPILNIHDFKDAYSRFRSKCGIVLSLDDKYYNEIIPLLSFAFNDLYFPREEYKIACSQSYNTLTQSPYDSNFYTRNLETQIASASELLKAITTFVQPKSVVDVGCGIGLIANKFFEFGATEVCGIDGDYVDRSMLQLSEKYFVVHDLTKPYISKRRYDLAMSFEVAEHLEQKYATNFVKSLCSLSDIITFSAAVPGQGGAHHVNERPQSYWVDIFAKNGYSAIDCIRPIIWNTKNIKPNYKQNTLLFINKDIEQQINIKPPQLPIFDIIHPDTFRAWHKWLNSEVYTK